METGEFGAVGATLPGVAQHERDKVPEVFETPGSGRAGAQVGGEGGERPDEPELVSSDGLRRREAGRRHGRRGQVGGRGGQRNQRREGGRGADALSIELCA